MPIKLGTNSIALPYSKAYLGSNLVYQKITDIYFNTCPFPTSWTKTSDTSYYATNDYGQWQIYSDYAADSDYACNGAFDNDSSTRWNTRSSNTTNYIGITLPAGISIKPLKIYCEHLNAKGLKIQGYNSSNGAWEDFATLTASSSNSLKSENLEITTENYYTDFRLYAQRNVSSGNARIHELQITEGYIKEV